MGIIFTQHWQQTLKRCPAKLTLKLMPYQMGKHLDLQRQTLYSQNTSVTEVLRKETVLPLVFPFGNSQHTSLKFHYAEI